MFTFSHWIELVKWEIIEIINGVWKEKRGMEALFLIFEEVEVPTKLVKWELIE